MIYQYDLLVVLRKVYRPHVGALLAGLNPDNNIDANSNLFYCKLGPKKNVPLELIEEKWTDMALPKEQFDELVRIGSFGEEVEWLKFFALACSTLGEVITHGTNDQI